MGKVVEAVVKAKTGAATLEQAVADLPDGSHIKSMLQDFVQDAKDGVKTFRQSVTEHFDATMVRVSGWFKRQIKVVTILVSLVVVAVVNVDTVAITTALSTDVDARTELVNHTNQHLETALQAEQAAAGQPGDVVEEAKAATQAAREALQGATQTLEAMGLPLGWGHVELTSPWSYVTKVIGLLVSAFAISLGAPFWFSILQTFNAVRATGEPSPVAASPPPAASATSGQSGQNEKGD